MGMARPRNPMPLYEAGRDRVEAIIRAQIEGGDSPERVVDAIVEAATSTAPRVRRAAPPVGRARRPAVAAALALAVALPGALLLAIRPLRFRLRARLMLP